MVHEQGEYVVVLIAVVKVMLSGRWRDMTRHDMA